MVKATIKKVLDTVRPNRNVTIVAVKGDYNARFVEAVIAVDGSPVDVSQSAVCTINAHREDGESKAFVGEINANGTVTVPITQWMLDIPDTDCRCNISVSSPDHKLSTTDFYVSVQNTPHEGDDVSEDDPQYDLFIQILAGEADRNAAEEQRRLNEQSRIDAENARNERFESFEEELSDLKTADQNKSEIISNHERRIKILESGVISGYETDDTVAYQKTVPANALLYAELEKSGTHTKIIEASTNLLPVNEYIVDAPYYEESALNIWSLRLSDGIYYISYQGGYGDGTFATTENQASIDVYADGGFKLNSENARYIEIAGGEQIVTVNATMHEDLSGNGSEFMSHVFTQMGIFKVDYIDQVPPYERYYEPGIESVPLTAIVSNGITYAIPKSLVELQKTMVSGEGYYGYDYIDWVNKKLVRCMKDVDMGTLTWKSAYNNRWSTTISDMKSIPNTIDEPMGMLCAKYAYRGKVSAIEEGQISHARTTVYVKDTQYATAEDFKAAVSGLMLYYEIAEPTTEDIDMEDFDRFIEVKPDEIITFVNAENGAIPSAITYQLKGV